jgi:hypothetical protein
LASSKGDDNKDTIYYHIYNSNLVGHIEVVKTLLSLLAKKSEPDTNYISERSLSLGMNKAIFDHLFIDFV